MAGALRGRGSRDGRCTLRAELRPSPVGGGSRAARRRGELPTRVSAPIRRLLLETGSAASTPGCGRARLREAACEQTRAEYAPLARDALRQRAPPPQRQIQSARLRLATRVSHCDPTPAPRSSVTTESAGTRSSSLVAARSSAVAADLGLEREPTSEPRRRPNPAKGLAMRPQRGL